MVVHPLPLDEPPPVAGRSLWQDAWIRLRRNRAAVASMVELVALALVGIFGPALWPHPYDRVYPQFVRVPASLEAYPRADTILPAFERELKRTRLEADPPVLEGGEVTVAVRSDETIDRRVLRYFVTQSLVDRASEDPRGSNDWSLVIPIAKWRQAGIPNNRASCQWDSKLARSSSCWHPCGL